MLFTNCSKLGVQIVCTDAKMFLRTLPKLLLSQTLKLANKAHKVKCRTCHSVFNFKELIQSDKVSSEKPLDFKRTQKLFDLREIEPSLPCLKTDKFTLHPVTSEHHEMALEVIKQHYLQDHVLVRARNMDLNDRALDEYLIGLFKQGNTLCARTDDGGVAGLCVNFACSPIDPRNLRLFAYYRQDPNTKDFLYFTAKLQETPNLWETFKQPKIFEIKMLTVLPEYRRQGLAVMLAEKSKEEALDQGYKVIRMDCMNPYDYKVAERCMLQCIVRFPLHKLRGPHAPYIKQSSDLNRFVRVYVDARTQADQPDTNAVKHRHTDLENLIE